MIRKLTDYMPMQLRRLSLEVKWLLGCGMALLLMSGCGGPTATPAAQSPPTSAPPPAAASGPSQSDIRSALSEVAAATVASGYGVANVQPGVTIDSFLVKATSAEGVSAKVLTDVTVSFVPAAMESSYLSGQGFRHWFLGGIDPKQKRTHVLAVNLYLRKYDTGWRLERYD